MIEEIKTGNVFVKWIMRCLCVAAFLTGSFNLKNNMNIKLWKNILILDFLAKRKTQQNNCPFSNNLFASDSLSTPRSPWLYDISIDLKGEPAPDTISNLWYAQNRDEWTRINYLLWKLNLGHLKGHLPWSITNQIELRICSFLDSPGKQLTIIEDINKGFSTSFLFAK